jgi:hypothetical protein
MHAIEITDRHHSTGQRPTVDTLRTAVHNVELSCRRAGPAHRVSGWLEEIVVRNVCIFSAGEPSGRRYG